MRDWDWTTIVGMILIVMATIGMMIEDKKPKPEPQPVYAPAQFVMEVNYG